MTRILMLLGACFLVPLPAQAAPVAYAFTGTVRQVSTVVPAPVSVGQQIPIVITLNENAQATQGQEPGSYSGLNPSLFTSATFAEVDYAGGLVQTATIVPSSSLGFRVVGLQTLFGFDLLLSGALPGALPNADLPLALDPGRFTQGAFSVTGAFSPEYLGYSGTIDLVAVPEPAAAAVLLGAVLALLAARRSGAQARAGASPQG